MADDFVIGMAIILALVFTLHWTAAKLFPDRTAEKLCMGLQRIGLNARLDGETVVLNGSPIARVRIEEIHGQYGTTRNQCFEVADDRLTPACKGVKIWGARKTSFPKLWRATGFYWKGNDRGLGIIERLNGDDLLAMPSTDATLPSRFDVLAGVEASAEPDHWCWVLRREEDDAPSQVHWECYEAIARHILASPVPADPRTAHPAGRASAAQSAAAEDDFLLPMSDFSQLHLHLEQRSWLWGYHRNHDARQRFLKRINTLQAHLPGIVADLSRHGALGPTDKLTSIYVIGSYPWVPDPADIDLFLIVEGEQDWITLTAAELSEWGIQVPELEARPAVEVVGHETLLRAKRGQMVRNAERVALRHTLLYGSVLLAGSDIFEGAMPTRRSFQALYWDIHDDGNRADWPELGGDVDMIKAKRRWREAEAKALRDFESHLPRKSQNLPG